MSAAMRAGYKQSEAGVIPEDWMVKRLGELADIETGLSKPKIVFGSGCPVVMVQNLYEGSNINFSGLRRVAVTEEEIQKYRLARGDVLIGNASVQRDGIGYANIFTSAPEDVIFAKYLYRASNLRKIRPLFLLQYLRTHFCRSWIISNSQTGTLTNLNKITATEIPIALPPLKGEQVAIEDALNDVDALIESVEQLIAKKRELKVAAIQQLLTGQVRLSGFREEWEVKRLGELFAFSGGHTASRDQLSDTGYCYLHYGDIHLSKKTFIDVEAEFLEIPKLVVSLSDVSNASILKDGDVVFVDASEDDEGTSKHIVVVNKYDRPYISGLHTIVARSKANRIDNLFKRYCFQTRYIKEQFRFFAVGTKVSGISKTSVAKVELHFPPSLEEQATIATVLSDMDAELAALEARRDKTRALKQGMMQELLTGRIRLV